MTILCAVDTSRRAARVADAARRLAAALDLPVVLVGVFDPLTVPAAPSHALDPDLTTERVEQHERDLARAALLGATDRTGAVAETPVFAEGDPRSEILRLLRAHDAGILVVGSAARKPLDRIMQGSLSAELVRDAPCPVVIVTDDAEPPGGGPILAGYDGSDHSLRAARHAAALAAGLGRSLVLLHVTAPGDAGARADEDILRELVEAARACVSAATGDTDQRLDVELEVEHGDPAERLIAAAGARGAALIVVGHRGRGALAAAVLGSVAADVVRQADRLVVVAGPRSEQPGA